MATLTAILELSNNSIRDTEGKCADNSRQNPEESHVAEFGMILTSVFLGDSDYKYIVCLLRKFQEDGQS